MPAPRCNRRMVPSESELIQGLLAKGESSDSHALCGGVEVLRRLPLKAAGMPECMSIAISSERRKGGPTLSQQGAIAVGACRSRSASGIRIVTYSRVAAARQDHIETTRRMGYMR